MKSPKTVDKVLSLHNIMLKKALEWDVLERMPCTIKPLRVDKGQGLVSRLRRVRATRRLERF
jgi:hypothetical protein